MPYADPIQEAQYQKAYRQRHKPRLQQQGADWRKRNKDLLTVAKRQDYERNADAYKARAKRCWARKPLWFQKYQKGLGKARRAKALIGNLEELQAFYQRVYSQQDHRCEYCQALAALVDVRINHKEPFTHGGRHEVANLAVSCKPCNRVKLGMPLKQWMEILSKSSEPAPGVRPSMSMPFNSPLAA